MKLERLTLSNFKNCEDADLRFGPITVIAGGNNAGKSAIKDALEIALTGAGGSTDPTGRGAQRLIRAGQEKFRVEATVQIPPDPADESAGPRTITIAREKDETRGTELSIHWGDGTEWGGGKRDSMSAFHKAIGAEQGVIRACLHAGHVASMTSEAQQNLFFGVLGLSFSTEKIDELVQASGATEEDCQLLYGGRDNTFLAAPARTEYGPEIFDEAHKLCYDKRRQAKRDMNNAAADVGVAQKDVSRLREEHPQLAQAQIDTKKAKDMKAQLDGLELKRDQLSEQKSRAESVPQQIEGVRAALAAIDEQLEARLRWEAERDEIAGGPKKNFAKQLTLLREKVENAERSQQIARDRVDEIDTILEAFSEGKPKCPISGLSCPMTDAAKRKLLENLNGERYALKAGNLDDVEKQEQIHADKELLTRYIEIAHSRPSQEDLETLRATKKAREKELEELVALKSEAGDSTELEALKERITRGHAKIRLVDQYLHALAKVDDLLKKQQKLQERAEAWERLVTALSPAGAKLKAVDKPLQDLQERIRARLKGYAPQYDLRINTTEAFLLEVQTPSTGEHWIEISELSTSECLRVGIALQDALCYCTGFGLLLVDNFDMLEVRNRQEIGRVLRDWAEEYETIIIITTKDEKPDPSPARTTYWVENGHVEVVQ